MPDTNTTSQTNPEQSFLFNADLALTFTFFQYARDQYEIDPITKTLIKI